MRRPAVTRARAAWLAAGVVVLAALGYLVRRRRRRPAPVIARQPPRGGVGAAPAAGVPSTEDSVTTEPSPTVEVAPVRTEVGNVVRNDEQPLATWARVAIIAVALLAFFAVSLIATKQV